MFLPSRKLVGRFEECHDASVPLPLSSIPVSQAWEGYPSSEWSREDARHLFYRLGYSALPEWLDRAEREGLQRTVDRLWGAIEPMPPPDSLVDYRDRMSGFGRQMREATDEEARVRLRQERQRDVTETLNDLALTWLDFAADPLHSAQEKWVAFLQNVLVVSSNSVRDAQLLFDYQTLLRERGTGSYPELCKAVSRNPAMMQYLDLRNSRRERPNENFARELFELFVLGEGHYTETDIKEAARAFTGYRIRRDRFLIAPAEHDDGPKTVFGRTGNWQGDDIIDLAFRQEAAETWLPSEFLRTYLTTEALPPGYLELLGRFWRLTGFDLDRLRRRVVTSNLFFAREYMGDHLKSPVELYLGALQQLRLQVLPLPRRTLQGLRAMGQPVFAPPNVRGWVGGRHWVDSSRMASRRGLIQQLFRELREDQLNADEVVALEEARSRGRERFFVRGDHLEDLARRPAEEIVDLLIDRFLALHPGEDYRGILLNYVEEGRPAAVRRAVITLMQSSPYQLS